MIFLGIHHYIKRRIDNKKHFPKDYKKILSAAINMKELTKYTIIGYQDIFSAKKVDLNATHTMIPFMITINSEWAYQLIYNGNDPDIRNAFRITLGHEMTHDEDFSIKKAKNKSLFYKKRVNRQFIYQINEVFCDYGAAQKMATSNREKLIQAIEFKRIRKNPDSGDFKHPSWAKRKEYVEKNDFNEYLIQKIADDVAKLNDESVDKSVIQEVCKYYKGKEIYLIPECMNS